MSGMFVHIFRTPVHFEDMNNESTVRTALQTIRSQMNGALVAELFDPGTMTSAQILRHLDWVYQEGFRCMVAGGKLGIICGFDQTKEREEILAMLQIIKDHPGVFGYFMIDEPLELIQATTLERLYTDCKAIAPNVPLYVNHSRQIARWENSIAQQPNPERKRYRSGQCDYVAISALEFRNLGNPGDPQFYQAVLEDTNNVSRNRIDDVTPNNRLFSSLQVFGRTGGSYYQPTSTELQTCIDILRSPQSTGLDIELAMRLDGFFIQKYRADTATKEAVESTLQDSATLRTVIADNITFIDTGENLLDRLISYWSMDETGTPGDVPRADSIGTNHLISVNTVTSTSSPNATSRLFTAANLEYLSRGDNADLSVGDIDFSFSTWVRLATKPANDMHIIAKRTLDTNCDYDLYWDSAGDRFEFQVRNAAGTAVTVTANNFGAPAIGTNYFITCWHDAAGNTLNISVNNGAANSQATAGLIPNNSTAAINIGRSEQHGEYWNGRIGPTGFWKKALSSTERTQLYNGGAGLHFTRFSTDLSSLMTSLTAYWNMDRTSGGQPDEMYYNHLADNNTVTSAAGMVPQQHNQAFFTAANSEYLWVASNSTLVMSGDQDFTICLWVTLQTKGADRYFVYKGAVQSTTTYEYAVWYDSATDRFRFAVGNNACNAPTGVAANALGSPAAGTRYFICCRCDNYLNEISIQVNGGTINTAVKTGQNCSATGNLVIGAPSTVAVSGFMDGGIDEVAIWKKRLLNNSVTYLYNSGNGKAFYDLSR